MSPKRKFEKWLNAVLAMLLGALGFSCDGYGESPNMYGCPTADYEVKGKVADEAGNPVEATLKAKYFDSPESSNWNYVHTYFLDGELVDECKSRNGKYMLVYGGTIFPDRTMIICTPVSDRYEADSLLVEFGKPEGGEGWYSGIYRATADFTLKERNTDE